VAYELLSRHGPRGDPRRHAATGLVGGALAIVAVSLVIAALKPVVDPSALTGLYLFAILPVAIGRGFRQAGIVALAWFLTYEYFFEPPCYTFRISRPEGAAALLVAVVTAYVVSDLARRAHLRAAEARTRAREAEEAQAAQRRLADEHAALRRVATLVARGVPTPEIFERVTREVGLLCDADLARMERFEPDGWHRPRHRLMWAGSARRSTRNCARCPWTSAGSPFHGGCCEKVPRVRSCPAAARFSGTAIARKVWSSLRVRPAAEPPCAARA
jgi:heme exporter protein D